MVVSCFSIHSFSLCKRTFLSISTEAAKSHPHELSRMVNLLILIAYSPQPNPAPSTNKNYHSTSVKRSPTFEKASQTAWIHSLYTNQQPACIPGFEYIHCKKYWTPKRHLNTTAVKPPVFFPGWRKTYQQLVPFITKTANTSFREGLFHSSFKHVRV